MFKEKLLMLKKTAAQVGLGITSALVTAGTVLATNQDAQEGINTAKGNLQTTSLTDSVANVTNIMITIIGIVSVIMLIIGGFRYVLSGGDQKGTSAAKDTILYAIIGVVVALLSYSIMNFVIGQF